ncbi:U11/U12 small nuclear ribonucleoprotein 25 kDa protein [Tanacetum coccineum]|uniref:U11/U12 small nuclear ribonucleoprotein 25 kDa protein n=1 Tax=Tanacetum coccineum TaxID=301880 RepID=A0ABQ5AKZ6_9ASTR
MTEPSSTGVKDDDSVALEYNTNNVKKAKLNLTLAALLDDPVLADVLKLDQTSFDVTVMNSATVTDLKLAVKKKVNEMEQSKMGHGSSSPRLI